MHSAVPVYGPVSTVDDVVPGVRRAEQSVLDGQVLHQRERVSRNLGRQLCRLTITRFLVSKISIHHRQIYEQITSTTYHREISIVEREIRIENCESIFAFVLIETIK